MQPRPTKPVTVEDLLAIAAALPERAPIAARLWSSAERSAKETWIGWLREYGGPGAYGRKKSGQHARQVYGHLRSPGMLLWLCEALGVPKSELRAAEKAARDAPTSVAGAAALRRIIPWERVEALLPAGARIDSPEKLRKIIARLSPLSPITDDFTALWRPVCRGQKERKKTWYVTQHEHWLGWLREQGGPGGYERKTWNRSAERVYDTVVNPQLLVYLAEAANLDAKLVRKGVNAALAKTNTMAEMSSAIRQIIPWGTFERALLVLQGVRREKKSANRKNARDDSGGLF